MEADGPVTSLPNGFDLSRFGKHVQAAYRGPTPDNPSLSLKYRLRKAAALDQFERRDAETRAEPVAPKHVASGNGFMLGSTRRRPAPPTATSRSAGPCGGPHRRLRP